MRKRERKRDKLASARKPNDRKCVQNVSKMARENEKINEKNCKNITR